MSSKSSTDKGKPGTVKKIYAICFLCLMLILGIVPVIKFLHINLPTEQEHPVEENGVATSSKEEAPTSFGIMEKYIGINSWITDSTEQYLKPESPLAGAFKNLQNISSNYTYGSVIYNGDNTFVKLPNGYLAGCFVYSPSKETQNNILEFSNWLNKNDIPFVHLITPDKGDDSVTTFPEGVPHGYAKTLNEYKAFLKENAVEYMEAKPTLLAENDDFYSWFYKSDHHWNVHAAFHMAGETAEYLNDELGIPADTDALDEGNYKLVNYPDSFLGSYGQKLGNSWKEDMEVYYPKDETDYHIEITSIGIDKEGIFDNTLIDQNCLGVENSNYCAFLYGDYPLISIENKSCHNGTRVLVIKYSFANAFCPYLASTVQYLDMIDPAKFDGRIRSYIRQTKPDAVILCTGVVHEGDEDSLRLK